MCKWTPNGPEAAETSIPHIKMTVGISSYDRFILYKGKTIDVSIIGISPTVQDVEGKYEVHDALSQLSIDLIPFNVPSQESSPMVHSKLQAFLRHASREANAGVALSILGLGVSVIEKRVEGAGAALRMLVDLGVIQMLGRSLRIPYGRCLDMPIEDKQLEELHPGRFLKEVRAAAGGARQGTAARVGCFCGSTWTMECYGRGTTRRDQVAASPPVAARQ